MDQTAVAAQTTSAVAAGSAEAHASVKVLAFDPDSGTLLTEQVTFENKRGVKKLPIEIPWKAWHQENVDVGKSQADKAALASMLENLHRQWDASAVEVQMMSDAGKTYLVAGANMPAKSLMLPACSKGFKVHDVTNEHPMAVRVSVALSKGNCDHKPPGPDASPKSLANRVDYLLLPELKVPTAVAVKPGEGEGEGKFLYSKDDSESMHPFWAVRRITNAKLQEERRAILLDIQRTGERKNVPEFNCEIVTKVHPAMCIASLGEEAVSSTRFVSVPFMTNVKDVVKGEELICELTVVAKPKKDKKRSWQDQQKDLIADAKKKAKAKPKL